MEFKTEAIMWNPELTKEHHNTFIKTANKIVEVVSSVPLKVVSFTTTLNIIPKLASFISIS